MSVHQRCDFYGRHGCLDDLNDKGVMAVWRVRERLCRNMETVADDSIEIV